MALSRRGFLLLADSRAAHAYQAPGERAFSDVSYAESQGADKKIPPLPAGARSVRVFGAKCVGCMRCIPACPSEILRPSSNPRLFGRPALDFQYGWCRPGCHRCAEVCPAGAIAVVEPKVGTGVAQWHAERCLAATEKETCTACLRHCPVKAISHVDGKPVVDPDKCIGCGACEHYCPARPKAAMSVEGRS